MEIITKVLIKTSPEKIWKVLTDFEKYPDWNLFIRYVKGPVQTSNKVEIRIEPPGSKGMTFKPTILVLEKNKELRWLGHLLVGGLFDGEHTFKITDNKDGTCTFTQGETFKGLLVPLFKKQLDNNTRKGFELMNEKLRELSEGA